MKKVIILAFVLIAALSCKKETKSTTEADINVEDSDATTTQSNRLTHLKGNFVFYDGAAVLQTSTKLYGVFITDKMKALNKKAEAFKSKPTDMVEVEIRGRVSNEKHEKILWEDKVEIVEIINVSAPKEEDNNVIKLGN